MSKEVVNLDRITPKFSLNYKLNAEVYALARNPAYRLVCTVLERPVHDQGVNDLNLR